MTGVVYWTSYMKIQDEISQLAIEHNKGLTTREEFIKKLKKVVDKLGYRDYDIEINGEVNTMEDLIDGRLTLDCYIKAAPIIGDIDFKYLKNFFDEDEKTG